MQCTEEIGLLSPGKASSHSTALPSIFCFLLFFLCAVFSCFHTTGCDAYSFTIDANRILNMRTIWVCAVHTKGAQAQTSLHKS